jgi:hypothetical protein
MTGQTLSRLLLAAIGDDGTGPLWRQLTPTGREVLRLAHLEARELRHPCLAGEHILLGLLREGSSPAAALLEAHGLDLATTRAELVRIGPTLPAPADPATALRNLGIDLEQIHRQLEDTFGTAAVHAAQRGVRRRPWWRGGHARPRPLCAYLLARRSFHLAITLARQRGDTAIGPEHLLHGVLHDACDPVGTHLSRRSRRQLTAHGWTPDRPNPLLPLLKAHGINPAALATQLALPS